MTNFEKFYPTDLLLSLPNIFFDITLADFEQIINNNFIQLETE